MRGTSYVGAIAILGTLCCSSSSSGPERAPANPCATRNATYIESCTETSGNCPSIPQQVINVNPDGTITLPTPISCATVTQTGCTARDSDCTFSTSNGTQGTETFETTFASDGSSATGVITVTLTNGSASCTGTYECMMTRR